MESTKRTKILVELDALHDIRLAVLANIDDTIPDYLLANNYHRRLSDEFHLQVKDPLIASNIEANYEKLYKERDASVLQESFMTNLIFEINKIVLDLEAKFVTGDPDIGLPCIDINIYPYKLNDVDVGIIKEVVKEQVGAISDIDVVYYDYKALNLSFIKQANYKLLVFYNFNAWLYEALQGMERNSVGVPSTIVMAPAIFPKAESVKELDKCRAPNGAVLDPFDSLTFKLAELFSLRFVDVKIFSLIYPEAK